MSLRNQRPLAGVARAALGAGIFLACGSWTLGCVTAPDDSPVALGSDRWQTAVSEDGQVLARLSLEGEALAQGTNVVLIELHATSGGARPLLESADVFMPAHAHGSTEPVIEQRGERYAVSFVLFMPGRWELGFVADLSGALDRVVVPVDVP